MRDQRKACAVGLYTTDMCVRLVCVNARARATRSRERVVCNLFLFTVCVRAHEQRVRASVRTMISLTYITVWFSFLVVVFSYRTRARSAHEARTHTAMMIWLMTTIDDAYGI